MAYSLLTKIPKGIDGIVDLFEHYVTKILKNELEILGSQIQKNPKNYIEILMTVHDNYNAFVKKTFNHDPAFYAAIDKGFRQIVNHHSTDISAPEVFAKYCDILLKKNPKNPLSEKEIETQSFKAIDLFKYIDDKDIFQKFYSRSLAKRLIHRTSVSLELEISIISQLKTVCGYEYTSKLQRMFTDVTLSTELSQHYKTYLQEAKLDMSEFNVNVLSAGSWPLSGNSVEFIMPLDVSLIHLVGISCDSILKVL